MREIKFKVWNKVKKYWVTDPISFEPTDIFYPLHENDAFLPLLYTGLKDNNGKEIYEGDVIEATIITDWLPTIGEVIFDNTFLFYASKNLSGNTAIFKLTNIKVIGNIHENPELLDNQ